MKIEMKKEGEAVNTEGVLKGLSEQTGLSVQEIRQEIKALQEKGYSLYAALAIYKSSIKGLLGGRVAAIVGRIIGKRIRDNIQLRDGSTSRVANLDLFIRNVNDGEEYELRRMSLWDDSVELAQQLAIDEVITAKVRLMDDGVSMRLVDTIEPTDQDFPSINELIQAVGTIPLKDISNYVGEARFFKGYVGRVFETQNGAGIEISDVEGGPVTVFLDPETECPEVGNEVVVYGYVSTDRNGIPRVNCRGLFR